MFTPWVSLTARDPHEASLMTEDGPEVTKSPLPTDNPQAGGLFVGAYFFLPWFLTASMAAAAASGSRYVPPGVTGLKSASSS